MVQVEGSGERVVEGGLAARKARHQRCTAQDMSSTPVPLCACDCDCHPCRPTDSVRAQLHGCVARLLQHLQAW